MYSPAQEVPSTPMLRLRHGPSVFQNDTPEAVVPDDFQDDNLDSYSVPGTPLPPSTPPSAPSPWTPRSRSLVRSASVSSTRRYIYQPNLLFHSPAVAASPKEQVVPGTPIGAFIPPTNAPNLRRSSSIPRHRTTRSTPAIITSINSTPYDRVTGRTKPHASPATPLTPNTFPNVPNTQAKHVMDATGDHVSNRGMNRHEHVNTRSTQSVGNDTQPLNQQDIVERRERSSESRNTRGSLENSASDWLDNI